MTVVVTVSLVSFDLCGRKTFNQEAFLYFCLSNTYWPIFCYWLACLEGFYIDHGDSNLDEESIDRLWLVIRSLKNPKGKYDYKINKFDTIKLGRIRFRVKDFRCEQMNLTAKELHDQELKEAVTVKTS